MNMFVVKYHVGAEVLGIVVLRKKQGMLRDWYVVARLPCDLKSIDSTVVHFEDGTDWNLTGSYTPQELLSMVSSLGGDDVLVETADEPRLVAPELLASHAKEAKQVAHLDRLLKAD